MIGRGRPFDALVAAQDERKGRAAHAREATSDFNPKASQTNAAIMLAATG
jgi:hypothetical protein